MGSFHRKINLDRVTSRNIPSLNSLNVWKAEKGCRILKTWDGRVFRDSLFLLRASQSCISGTGLSPEMTADGISQSALDRMCLQEAGWCVAEDSKCPVRQPWFWVWLHHSLLMWTSEMLRVLEALALDWHLDWEGGSLGSVDLSAHGSVYDIHDILGWLLEGWWTNWGSTENLGHSVLWNFMQEFFHASSHNKKKKNWYDKACQPPFQIISRNEGVCHFNLGSLYIKNLVKHYWNIILIDR